ncbi:MAG TPA: hypothetical protein DEQ30_12580 [Porphyromonadaceae bacterium]|nr:hypothetical protein [Porphyromonadaceae bacterium]
MVLHILLRIQQCPQKFFIDFFFIYLFCYMVYKSENLKTVFGPEDADTFSGSSVFHDVSFIGIIF